MGSICLPADSPDSDVTGSLSAENKGQDLLMAELRQRRYLVADIIYKLPSWIRWVAYQPNGYVIAYEERPRLGQSEEGFTEWDVRSRHFIIGVAELEDGCGFLEAVAGEDCLDHQGFRHRPKVIRGLSHQLAPDQCALTADPTGEVHEWFLEPPAMTAECWVGCPGSRSRRVCWLAQPDQVDWKSHLVPPVATGA